MIFAVPTETPLTTPLLFTVATAVLLLLHAPPVEVVLNVVVEPRQTEVEPEIVPTAASTVTTWDTPQPPLIT